MNKNLIILVFALAVLCSCGASGRMAYVRDLWPDSVGCAAELTEIRLQPYDKVSIVVSSRDPQLSALFNLPVVTGSVADGDTIGGRGLSAYTISREGDIDFPVVGRMHVAGLTRDSLARYVKRTLADRQLLADGVVTVEFANLSLSVLGEVRRPGRFAITRDCVTILDAIGMAGDLTDRGDSRKVVVIRREGGRQRAYTVDLSLARSLYSSPVFCLRQNDVVYVSPR